MRACLRPILIPVVRQGSLRNTSNERPQQQRRNTQQERAKRNHPQQSINDNGTVDETVNNNHRYRRQQTTNNTYRWRVREIRLSVMKKPTFGLSFQA